MCWQDEGEKLLAFPLQIVEAVACTQQNYTLCMVQAKLFRIISDIFLNVNLHLRRTHRGVSLLRLNI